MLLVYCVTSTLTLIYHVTLQQEGNEKIMEKEEIFITHLTAQTAYVSVESDQMHGNNA